MKHKIIAILSILIILGAATLCGIVYRNYRHTQNLQSAIALTEQQTKEHAKAIRDAVQRKHEQAELSVLEMQCRKDQAAYAAMTPSQRLRSSQPTCDPNLQLVQ